MGSNAVGQSNLSSPFNSRLLQPVFRAYGWALLSVTAPRIIALLVSAAQRKKELGEVWRQILATIKRQLGPDKLPASFAILVSGAVVLPSTIASIVGTSKGRYWKPTQWHRLRFTCTFLAGLCSFALLNRPRTLGQRHIASADSSKDTQQAHRIPPRVERKWSEQNVYLDPSQSPVLAGRTIDLTFFGIVRATDICLRSLWSYYIPRHNSGGRALHAARTIDWLTGPTTFIASSAVIMWAWFYSPYNLPTAYQRWISNAAQLDGRLLQSLREAREGTFIYGKETGRGSILRPMCRELHLPEKWGDPAQVKQIPCAVVHSGAGSNCEWHGMTRLARAWLFAMKMYLPINLLLFTRRKPTSARFANVLREAARSSAFLGAFVAFFYYGVCLARRRVGPKVFPSVTPQQWDSGLSVAVGSLMCGTSIFIEKPQRRQEIAFFVAPRALATAFPRRYDRQYIWREQVAFATCSAIILTAAVENPRQIRGVFGRLLTRVLA